MVANGFNEVDFTMSQRAFAQKGAKVSIVSCETGLVNSWRDNSWGHHFPVDANVSTVLGSDHDCIFIPGGERSIAKLSESAHSKRILRSFIDANKPVALSGAAIELLKACDRPNVEALHSQNDQIDDEFIALMLAEFNQETPQLKAAA